MVKRTDGSVPGMARRQMLAAVNMLDVATADQVRRFIGYAPKSLHSVQAHLKWLADTGYLYRLAYTYRDGQDAGTYVRGGSSPLAYTVAKAGWTYLRSLDIPTIQRFHGTERRSRSQQSIREQLLINAVLLLAKEGAETNDCIELTRVIPRWQLQRNPCRISVPGGKQRTLIPDSWLAVQTLPPSRVERAGFAIEVDAGTTTDAGYFRRKLEGYLHWDQAGYEAYFGMPYLQVLVIAVPGERRRRELMKWCEELLARSGRQDEYDLFLFSAINPERGSAAQFFTQQQWLYPVTRQAVALLDLTPQAVPRQA